MIAFALIATVLVAIALMWVVRPLLRDRAPPAGVASGASNLRILKDQLAELERDLGSGILSPQQYEEARDELERRALEEAKDAPDVETHPSAAPRHTAFALLISIPVVAALLYWQLGNPDALSGRVASAGAEAHEVEVMVASLAARLEKTPDDAAGWVMLGRSYTVMQRFGDAARAYARAVALVPDDADLLTDYADALAMSQDRRIEGKPLALVEQALTIDPMHWKALALAGSAAFDRKDYKAAVTYWERLRERQQRDPEFSRTLDANIAEARELGGVKTQVAAVPAKAKSLVQGTVSLSGTLAARTDPSDTVFIYARAREGPRMPLAIMRRQVKDLPVTFILDDTQAMSPQMKLSNFSDVVITARVSKAASATPQSGDLQGVSPSVKVGTTGIKIAIDSTVP